MKKNINWKIKKSATFIKSLTDKFLNYSLDKYYEDILLNGLKKTWIDICDFFVLNNINLFPFFKNVDLGLLYEEGLAIENKLLKKINGQYYTPDDVASVLSSWLRKVPGEVVCDVGCGTGRLILNYLDLIGFEEAKQLIMDGKLYLYDFDETALRICKTILVNKYGLETFKHINDIYCDFLDKKIKLPKNCKVISNPPYAKIVNFSESWEITKVINDSKELYSAFMEKIFSQSLSSVIITPFSFISGDKFYTLREMMSKSNEGFIVSFDNVPGNIFNGKKFGTFNSNTTNSVRAAITVSIKNKNNPGYKISPFIRFKNSERKDLLNVNLLENLLPNVKQIVNKNNTKFIKVDSSLNELLNTWKTKSKYKLEDFFKEKETNFMIDIPNSCRYFTTGSSFKLSRSGSYTKFFDNEDEYIFNYCFINSSFPYWWWRIYDGGITLPLRVLKDVPIPFNLLSEEDKKFFKSIFKDMKEKEKKYITKKMNSGVLQENIKFPEEYKKIINNKILSILGFDSNLINLDSVHSNSFFESKVCKWTKKY
ncbi:N-6 DNA methylase [Mycoplasmopsis arginini]|uniref:N-6 DNA methylase n=1 Tax=Mycoplasmopsis arginini TaxID=2094 RepID=UPI0002D150C5|nr:N-6 DNA methylase [Mycoplasmopsis arginini]ENY69656.1 DNA methyltransferase family protein [Mycoplasmopsis arginini 7264]MDI3348746.1 N-6 DNA methylase [Mycoplasmopsis arginini]BAQ54469.1 DNA methyltransferase family protein [Mycoplasmopsis arginini]